MTIEEASGPAVELWPDNVQAINLLIAMGTQWRWVGSGYSVMQTGLDYNALPSVMRMVGIPQSERADVFNDLRVLEDVVLEMMRAKK